MAKLGGEEVYPGCSVYDVCYGPGTIVSIECGNKIHVSFGSAGRPRQYSEKGMTGKLCNRTLFHVPPAIIEFGRDECAASKKRVALMGVMEIFDDVSKIECCNEQETCCETVDTCCK